jgi:hypothetical protein
MSLSGSGRIIDSVSSSSRAVRYRLVQLFRENPGREFTAQQLFLKVRPPSAELLSVLLDQLTREGVIRRVFRVESPRSHGGIKDFQSIADIPDVLHDWTVDEDIEVQANLIRPIFKTLPA